MPEWVKWGFGLLVAAGVTYWLINQTMTTEICVPYTTSDGFSDASCQRWSNERAQQMLRTEPGAFISNPEDWKRIREHNLRVGGRRPGN